MYTTVYTGVNFNRTLLTLYGVWKAEVRVYDVRYVDGASAI